MVYVPQSVGATSVAQTMQKVVGQPAATFETRNQSVSHDRSVSHKFAKSFCIERSFCIAWSFFFKILFVQGWYEKWNNNDGL